MVSQQFLSGLPEGKQVQKHLKSHAVEHIAVVKVLLSRFVVHHPVIGAPSCIPGIHPVHKTPQQSLHTAIGNGDGRQALGTSEAHFKIFGRKLRFLQFLPQLLHNHIQLLHISLEQVGQAFRFHLRKPLLGIFLTVTMGNLQSFLLGNLVEATQIPDTPGCVLQHRMHISTKLRRVNFGFFTLLRPHTVFQEIGHAAFCLAVNLRCGQI